MGVQEQAFREYYAAMTDADLLRTAANRSSFVETAQMVLAEELHKRNLTVPEPAPPPKQSWWSKKKTR